MPINKQIQQGENGKPFLLNNNMCQCCGIRKAQGRCRINGVIRNLPHICRYCFIRNPEDRELGKRNKSHNYYRYHER